MGSLIITKVQVENNDVVSFLNVDTYIRSMSQILPQNPTYISYRYDSITISQVAGEAFTFTVYPVTDVGGNAFTALNFSDPADVVQAKTVEIYRLLVTAIFKGCCECGDTMPECSIQYTAGDVTTLGRFQYDGSSVLFNYVTGNNQDFTGFFPIVQDGSWVFVFSKTDPTVYAVIQLSNFTDFGTYCKFDAIELNANGVPFVEGTQFCIDFTSVGGSLVQGWQDTLDINSTLDKDNTVDGAGYNFTFDNNASFVINSAGGSIETNATGASINAGANQVTVTTGYVDIITPLYSSATTGQVLALTAGGHVEYTDAGTGTVTYVGLDMPPAFTVTGSPIETSGTFGVTVEGTEDQYINGIGELATLPVYTVLNGLHTQESPIDPTVFHLGGKLTENTSITTTAGIFPSVTQYKLSVEGLLGQDTTRPFNASNIGQAGVAQFYDFASGNRTHASVNITTDIDLFQPALDLVMNGNLPAGGILDGKTAMLRMKYNGEPSLAAMSIDYEFINDSVSPEYFIAGRLTTEVTDYTQGSEDSKFTLELYSGGVQADKAVMEGKGQLTLNNYGASTFADSTTNINNSLSYVLGVDNTGKVWKTSAGTGTVTSIDVNGGTGISVSPAGPITTSGTFTVTNTAPDQIVSIETTGTGLSVSGTYPSFTLQNTAPDQIVTLTEGANVTITGAYPDFTIAASGGGPGTTYTVNNGLTENPANNFQLGGDLIKNTEINLDTTWDLDVLATTGKKMLHIESGLVKIGDIDDVTSSGLNTYAEIGQSFKVLYGGRGLEVNEGTGYWAIGDLDDIGLGSKIEIKNSGQTIEMLGEIGGTYNRKGFYQTYGSEILTILGDVDNGINGTKYSCDDVNELHSFNKRLQLGNYNNSTAYQSWGGPFPGTVGASVGVLNVDNLGHVFVGTGGGSSPLTTKGDIYTFSTVDARLPVGTNGYILSADSTTATGLKWVSAPSGSGITTINGSTDAVQEFFIVFGGTGESTPTIITSGGDHTIHIPYADGGRDGVITAAQFLDFSAKVPGTRTLTINGTGYDLTADRSWTIGLQNVITQDAVLTTNNIIDGGNFDLTFDNNYKFNIKAEQKIELVSTNTVATANIWASVIDGSSQLYYDDGTNASYFKAKGSTIEVATFDVATKSVGDVLTLVDPATGEAEWATPASGGGGAGGRNYYLNGGTNQGTFVGNTYYEMSPIPVVGTNADFVISTNGYIASFITDAGDPNQTVIPAGNWNFEMWFSANTAGGTPSFYVELSKYDTVGGTFTPIATSAGSPEGITNGGVIDLYVTALAVPQTSLTSTDRLAIRVWVNHSSKTITLHTQDSHLCQVITTFASGIVSLNGLTGAIQTFATPGTSGTAPSWTSAGTAHTLNIPLASTASVTAGLISNTDYTTFNNKVSTSRSISTTTPLSGGGNLGADLTLTIADAAADGTTKGAATFTAVDFNSSAGVISIDYTNAQAASSSNKGFLTSADWTRFDSFKTQTIGATVDGSGGTITIGVKGYVQIPYACTITSWRVIANAVGSIQFDVFRATSGTIPTVSLIGGGNKPLLSTAQTNSAAPSSWTSTAIAANDMLAFNVDSATTVSWAIVQLTVTRT